MPLVNSSSTTQGYRSSARSIGLTLTAHTSFGLYVVLVKYLLRYLPPFRLLAVAFSIAVIAISILSRRALRWRNFWCIEIWLLSATMTVRSICKLLALQFTLATYVQLIDLVVPFLTPLVAQMLLREAMPPRTLSVLAMISFGSFLVITTNPFNVQLPNGNSDLVGIAFALVSATAMALGVVYTRYLTERKLSPASLFLQQTMAIAVTYGVLSAVKGESWQPFRVLTVSTWAIYGLFILFIVIGGGLIQILAISRVNAALFSTLLSWRLVTAVGAGWALLGERLTSVWQGIGIVIVIVALTVFLRQQATTDPMPPTSLRS